ncbi:hypothetical protein H310_02215 [Aphanomyces invadans]|uniref:Uncharacterized protein n=1 Tax=Aphanomyces invadans TaxID=157072 RepID=A0A024UQ53_9STRA|nr:hypothetical protein H310_02215 [Aphanomyces invadans]ETW07783.1 hypothetical protein H310_02215 [Aphanomyces invadans]|eukprot:XP_008863876.1 hypothetical protein H310_02215 [Aphanomyces invadans]
MPVEGENSPYSTMTPTKQVVGYSVAVNIGFEASNLRLGQQVNIVNAVCKSFRLDQSKCLDLIVGGCHDELPASLMRDVEIAAEIVHQLPSTDAQLGFEAILWVVDASMYDLAVSARAFLPNA